MNRNPNFKTISYAMPTANIKALAKDLKAAGYEVAYDGKAGTMVAKLDGEDVARALQMGRGRPWSLRADTRVVTPIN